jgi:hypothetical protein
MAIPGAFKPLDFCGWNIVVVFVEFGSRSASKNICGQRLGCALEAEFSESWKSRHFHIPRGGLIRWDEKAGLRRDAIRSQGLTRSRRNAKETGL